MLRTYSADSGLKRPIKKWLIKFTKTVWESNSICEWKYCCPNNWQYLLWISLCQIHYWNFSVSINKPWSLTWPAVYKYVNFSEVKNVCHSNRTANKNRPDSLPYRQPVCWVTHLKRVLCEHNEGLYKHICSLLITLGFNKPHEQNSTNDSVQFK